MKHKREVAGVFAVVLGLVAVRVFVASSYYAPSSSMAPTLLIGDRLIASRASYGLQVPWQLAYFVRWQTPQPGDVVVFEAPPWAPANPGEDWIKRVVAGPGQDVRVESGELVVDGVRYEQRSPTGDEGVDDDGLPRGALVMWRDYNEFAKRWSDRHAAHKIETVPRGGSPVEHGVFNDLPPNAYSVDWPVRGLPPSLRGLRCTDRGCTVEDGYVFVVGDNRDNSSDSRSWGAVPIDNVKAKLVLRWLSIDESQGAPGLRWDRLGAID